jgi:hypothetical protein
MLSIVALSRRSLMIDAMMTTASRILTVMCLLTLTTGIIEW